MSAGHEGGGVRVITFARCRVTVRTLPPVPVDAWRPGGGRSRPALRRRRQIRRSLAARDGACCFYCGRPFPDLVGATIDHLVPQSQIPGWKMANLVLACLGCNQAKGDELPQVFLRRLGWPLPARAPEPASRCARVRGRFAGWLCGLAAVVAGASPYDQMS